MTGFIYKWTNLVNGKWYIGSHKGTIDDGYRHSSKSLRLAEQKYGIDNFVREILFEGDYETDDIRGREADFLQKHDAANNPLSYNQSNIRGKSCVSREVRLKLKEAATGRILSEESCEKISNALTNLPKTKEHVQNMSRSLKGRKAWNKGIPRTEECKQKQSASMKAHKTNQ